MSKPKPIHIVPKEEDFPFNRLTDRKFEKLLYRIFKKLIAEKDVYVSKFSNVKLRSGVGERGEDCSLYFKKKKNGLIQCKKYNKNLSPKEVGQEIIKFAIHAIVDKNFIPDKNNFTYFFAVSKDFSNTSTDLLANFSIEVFKHKDYQQWIEEVLKKNKAFKSLTYEEIESELKIILQKLDIIPINETDINGWLSKYPDIAQEFFSPPLSLIPFRKISRNFLIGFSLIFVLLVYISYKIITQSTFQENKNLTEGFIPEVDSIYHPTFKPNDDYFKILLLPFKPEDNCTFQETDYEGQLVERLRLLKEEENLNLEAELNKNYSCPQTNSDAQTIGKNENADIVIWGHYDEKCLGPVKVRLRYTLVKGDYRLEKEQGDSEMQTLIDLSELRRGFLQEDIDYIFQWSSAQIDYKRGNFQKGIKRLVKLENSTCKHQLYDAIIDGYTKLKNYGKVIDYYSKILDCPTKSSYNIPNWYVFDEIGNNFLLKKDTVSAYKYFQKAILENYRLLSTMDGFVQSGVVIEKDSTAFKSRLNKLLSDNKYKGETALCYANFLLEIQDTTNAINYLQKAIKINDSLYHAYDNLADIYVKEDKQKAINLLKAFVNQNPRGFWVSHVFSKLSDLSTNLDSSLYYLNKAINTDETKDIWLYERRAEIYMKLGSLEKALEDYTNYIDSSDYKSAYDYEPRINVYLKLGQFEDALNDYDAIFKIVGYDGEYLKKAIEICKKEELEDRLKSYLSNVSTINELSEEQIQILSDSYLFLEEADSVEKYQGLLISNFPNSYRVPDIIEIYKKLDDETKLRFSLNELSQSNNLSDMLLKTLAESYYYISEEDSMTRYNNLYITACTKNIQRDTSKSNLIGQYNVRGISYSRAKEYEKAIADFDSAIALSPNSQVYQSNKEYVLKKLRYEKYPILKYIPYTGGLVIIIFHILLYYLLSLDLRTKKKVAKYLSIQKNIKKLSKSRSNKKLKELKELKEQHKIFLEKFELKKKRIEKYHVFIIFNANMLFGLLLFIHFHHFYLLYPEYGSLRKFFVALDGADYWAFGFATGFFTLYIGHFIVSSLIRRKLAFILVFTNILNFIFFKYLRFRVLYLIWYLILLLFMTKYSAIVYEGYETTFAFDLHSTQLTVFYEYIALVILSGIYFRNMYYLNIDTATLK